MIKSKQLRMSNVLLAALAVGALCACRQQPAMAAAGDRGDRSAAASVDGPNRSGYEVVLETRPENLRGYVGRSHAFYDLCVASAQALHLPVNLFVVLPKDFVMSRKTYTSDGPHFLEKSEDFDFDSSAMLPESACATRIAASVITRVWRDGKLQAHKIDRNGVSTTEPPINQPIAGPDGRNRLKPYTVRQNVLGIAVRCLPPESPVISSGVMMASCVADTPGDTTLLNVEGKPILVHARMPSIERDPRFASILVTTPKSVAINKAVAESQFRLP